MRMHEVQTSKDKKNFLKIAITINAQDSQWIRPLDKDIEEVFDEQKNKFFKRGVAKRWLLLNDAEECIGRVAAFVNRQYKEAQPTGGIGFFECINDQKAADFIFDHCKNWLQEQGMEAMDGPINFGERDKWWGLLVEGFHEPLYGMNYNPPYYQQLFEAYGFQPYFHQHCYALSVDNKLQDKFYQRHAEISLDKSYKAIHMKKRALEKYAKDFTIIYNKAWASHGGGKELEEKQVVKLFNTMKPVMDERLNWFVYHNDEPIAFWINLPDLNQWFKKMNGHFSLLYKLYFLFLKMFSTNNRFVGLVFGIIPAYQGKGIDAFMIVEGAEFIKQHAKNYTDFEMQWIGDFNPKMINIAESLGTHLSRKLSTYRFLFDRTKPFVRHKTI
ncbi:MAG: hypothetical protein RLZ39_1430 [Bacteroidota bacterium]